jgi:cephalosporin hydroxylase
MNIHIILNGWDVPIIQFPQDIIALQEIFWTVKPAAIVETGVARGGSIIFHASMLKMMGISGRVIGIDIDIRDHNKAQIVAHPMSDTITMIEGDSTDPAIIEMVKTHLVGQSPVVVILDSNHTADHVYQELTLYSELVTKGSYLIVFDTIIEGMPEDFSDDRPWAPGNSPQTALEKFLLHNKRFQVDSEISDKLLISVAPNGYLKCIQ